MAKFIVYEKNLFYIFEAKYDTKEREKFLDELINNYSYIENRVRKNIIVYNDKLINLKNDKYEIVNYKLSNIKKISNKCRKTADSEESILIYPEIYRIIKMTKINNLPRRLLEWMDTKEVVETKLPDNKMDKAKIIREYFNLISFELIDTIDKSVYFDEIETLSKKLEHSSSKKMKEKLYKLSKLVENAQKNKELLNKFGINLNIDNYNIHENPIKK